MTPELFPLAVEVSTSLLFCGVLIYLRKSLTMRAVSLWVLLWLARGAASLFAVRLLTGSPNVVLLLYAPLQIAFSIALVMIAVRLEGQREQLTKVNEELVRLRQQAASQTDLDPLTGLKNRSSMARWMEEERNVRGLVVVCDMDDFRLLNDRYGHLVGDEILHGVGKLISRSIRDEDLAFRWGGDEFVIFFRTEEAELVEARMRGIEGHLLGFHIRQHGTTPVRFSWGMAATAGRPLKESLEEADRLMYELKRARRVTTRVAEPHA
jgi:diguanylate cyclase (GGDEF)-like protein